MGVEAVYANPRVFVKWIKGVPGFVCLDLIPRIQKRLRDEGLKSKVVKRISPLQKKIISTNQK